MSDRLRRCLAGWCGPVLALLFTPVFCAGCFSSSVDPTPTVPSSTEASTGPLDLELAMQMLSSSWMLQAAADPSIITQLIDAPGGEGWLRLFHGDLNGAEALFLAAKPMVEPDRKGSARAGLARVHLDRARALMAVADLQQEVAEALVRYRREHRREVRQGPYNQVLAALVLQAAKKQSEEEQGGGSTAAGSAPYLVGLNSLLQLRKQGSHLGSLEEIAGGLPPRYRDRLLFAEAMGEGDVLRAEPLLPALLEGGEDVIDPLGKDSEAGVSFEALYFDSEPVRALARFHLARAWFLGAGLQGPGEAIALAVQHSWGAEVPDAIRSKTLPGAGPQPEWLPLFVGPAIDKGDWEAYWAKDGEGKPFLSLLQDQLPAVPWLDGSSSADVDAILRAAAQIEPTLRAALIQSVGSEGASLAQDLGFAATTLDRLLRTRMAPLLAEGHALAAKRLAERSLDAEPTRLGGASSSASTRVSYRNDRAFLVDLARCLWKAGQVDAALSYIHPLSEEDPLFRGLAYYLGQLDAARSIRVQGKTAQQ